MMAILELSLMLVWTLQAVCVCVCVCKQKGPNIPKHSQCKRRAWEHYQWDGTQKKKKVRKNITENRKVQKIGQ